MEVHEQNGVLDLWERVTKKEQLQESYTDNTNNIRNL